MITLLVTGRGSHCMYQLVSYHAKRSLPQRSPNSDQKWLRHCRLMISHTSRFRNVLQVLPRKLTWQGKIQHLKMHLPLRMGIFYCHVSFQESTHEKDYDCYFILPRCAFPNPKSLGCIGFLAGSATKKTLPYVAHTQKHPKLCMVLLSPKRCNKHMPHIAPPLLWVTQGIILIELLYVHLSSFTACAMHIS